MSRRRIESAVSERTAKAFAEWDDETKAAARELFAVGEAWEKMMAHRRELSARRTALYRRLEESRVPHSMIAEFAKSTKGAVEQVLSYKTAKTNGG